MKKSVLKPMMILAIMMLMASVACARPATQAQDVQRPPQADTIEVMSQAMGRNIKNVVIVPNQYFEGDTL